MRTEGADVLDLVLPGGVKLTVNKPEVASREVLPVSLMPEGLLDALPPAQAANLVAYLQSPDGKSRPGALPAAAWRVDGAVEGESLRVLAAQGGRVSTQAMTKFKASRWSGNDQLRWADAKPGDTLSVVLPVREKGDYQLTLVCTKAHDYGRFELRLDGKPVTGPQGLDLFNPNEVVTSGELDAGRHSLDVGDHTLEVRVLSPNPLATPRNLFGLDFIKLEPK